MTFIVGCGRSGTTILGKVLANHPQVSYRFEPYHLWAALDSRTDVLNLFHQGETQLMMDSSLVTDQLKLMFPRLFKAAANQILIEKTPLNAFRIGYLRALMPNAKFIHIVRDGINVAHSIGRIATGSPYKIAGKPDLNQWWGVAGCKWESLQREGAQTGYWPESIPHLQTQVQRGAYEWLTSLEEIERWRGILDENLLEIVYEQLIINPRKILITLCEFLELEILEPWLMAATQAIRPQTTQATKSLELPGVMTQAFNHYQQKYQFAQHVTSMSMS